MKKTWFSTYGYKAAVAAPGGGYVDELGNGYQDFRNILSTISDNTNYAKERPYHKVSDGYYCMAGTSMACPHVSGLAAVIKSYFPQAPAEEIYGRIMAGADNIDALNPEYESLLGIGRINVYNSLTVTPKPLLKLIDIQTAKITSGEKGEISITLRNYWLDAFGVSVSLSTDHPQVQILQNEIFFEDILSGQTKSNVDNPFLVVFDDSIPLGERVHFNFTVSCQNANLDHRSFSLHMRGFDNIGPKIGLSLNSHFIPLYTAMDDLDNDSWADILFMGLFPTEALLYHSNQAGSFVNVTEQAGLDNLYLGLPMVSTFIDVDNDGYKDLFIGDLSNLLFKNNGDGTFSDISSASGVAAFPAFYDAAATLDYDNDGFLDIVGGGSKSLFLLRNSGTGTFTEDTETSGLPANLTSALAQIKTFDYNNDTYQDVFVLTVSRKPAGIIQPGELKLYLNNGDGTFSETTLESGVNAETIGTISGIAVGDYNNDGYQDLFLSGDRRLVFLYKNNGDGTFLDVTEHAGDIGQGFGAFFSGNDFIDYDNDGDLDLHLTSVSLGAETNKLFRNNGDGTFTNVTDKMFPADIALNAASACMGDYDKDGDIDIYAPSWILGRGAFLENIVGVKNNWIAIDLMAQESNSDAIGTRVEISYNGLLQVREVKYGSLSSQPVHFGLGPEAELIEKIDIYWPGGIKQELRNITPNQIITVLENAGLLGDLNNDSKVDIFDVIKCTRQVAGKDPKTPEADVNFDGEVDIFDVAIIAAIAVGKNPNEPITTTNDSLLNPIPDQEVTIGNSLELEVSSEELPVPAAYSLINPPAGATIGSDTGDFTWKPDASYAGKIPDIKVKVSYVKANVTITDEESFKVEVKTLLGDLNNDSKVDISDVMICTDQVTDPKVEKTPEADVNFDGVVDVFDIAIIVAIALGKDPSSPISSQNPALLEDIPDQEVTIGSALIKKPKVFSTSLATVPAVYSLKNPPRGATIGSSTGAFSWKPNQSYAGKIQTITVVGTYVKANVTLTVQKSFKVEVKAIENTKPEIVYLRSRHEATSIVLYWYGKDAKDGVDITYSYKVDNEGWSEPISKKYIRIYYKDIETGTHTIQVKAIDKDKAESEAKSLEFTIR